MIITHIPNEGGNFLDFFIQDSPPPTDKGIDKTIRAGLLGSICGLIVLSFDKSESLDTQTVSLVAILNISWYIISKYIGSDNKYQKIEMMGLFTIMIGLIIYLNKNKDVCEIKTLELQEQSGQDGGGLLKNMEMDRNVSEILKYFIIGFVCILLYKLYINYRDNKRKEKNKKIKGGEVVNDGQIINSDITYDIKPTDMIDKNILQLVIALVVLIILYTNDFLKTNSLSSFIQDQLLNPSNLNILRLMFFPIIIITIIIIIGGGKILKNHYY